MVIVHVSAECYPMAKAGGLGDVVGALPKYQKKQGDEAMVEQYLQDIKSLQGIQEYDKGIDIPFIAENEEKNEVKQNLTNLLIRDVGDISSAEKEADKWLKLVEEGKLSMQD